MIYLIVQIHPNNLKIERLLLMILILLLVPLILPNLLMFCSIILLVLKIDFFIPITEYFGKISSIIYTYTTFFLIIVLCFYDYDFSVNEQIMKNKDIPMHIQVEHISTVHACRFFVSKKWFFLIWFIFSIPFGIVIEYVLRYYYVQKINRITQNILKNSY